MVHLAAEDNFQSIKTAKARSGYRVQSLRKGHDRQYKNNPICRGPSDVVTIAPSRSNATGLVQVMIEL
jgi:hypothetical protein